MDIPLSSFIDFVLKSGSPKMTCAKKIKSNLTIPYDPITDYYKRFREGVQEVHRSGLSKNKLGSVIGHVPANKHANYEAMIMGYQKYIGTKKLNWFEPPTRIWNHAGIKIRVNPELGLEWSGKKYLIKLYLKADKPSKDRASTVLALMYHNLKVNNCELGLLDVRNSKMYLYEKVMSSLVPLVEAEAVALEFMLRNI